MHQILTGVIRYSYRHSHFLTLQPSSRSTFSADRNAPLPINHPKTINPAVSAVCFSPATLSAHDDSTSELLRTLSMVAASEPTSWLSVPSHSLVH